MKHTEVTSLLRLITSLDRTPFPEDAADAWLLVLEDVHYNDAEQAVTEHYGALGARDNLGRVRQVIPADVRTRARAIAEHRARAARRALPAGTTERRGSTGRPAEVEAALAEARQRIAEAERKLVAA